MTARPLRTAGWGLLLLALVLALLAALPSAGASHEAPPTCGYSFSAVEGTNGWYRGAFYVSLVPSGPYSAVEYSYDGSSNATYQYQSFYVPEGVHTLVCIVVDHEGGRFATTRAFQVDGTAPTCSSSFTGTYSPSSGWYTGVGAWSVAWSDGTSGVWYRNYTRNSTGPFPYTEPVSLPDGIQTVTCRATDYAGNTYESTNTYYVDARPPSSCGVTKVYDASRGLDLTPRNGWYAAGSPASYGLYVYLSAVDEASGAGTMVVRVNNGSATQLYPGSSMTLYGEGAHSLSCVAYDGAGNSATYYSDLNVDGTRPTCTGTYTGTTGRNGWRVSGQFVLTARDDASGLALVNSSVASVPSSLALGAGIHSRTVQVDRDGSYGVTCLATDQAGLVSQLTTFSVKLDRVAPACDVQTSGTRGEHDWFVSPPRVTMNVTDADSGVAATVYQLGAGPEQSYVTTFTHRAEGNLTASCRVTDRAGNVGRDSEPLALDTQAPNLCASAARDERGNEVKARREWFAKAVAFELLTEDNVSGLQSVQFDLDGTPIPGVTLSPNEARVSLPIDQRGTHTITCSAVDRAGHRAGPISIPVNIDDSLPVCIGRTTGESLAGWNRGPTTVTLSASDAGSGLESFLYSVDGGPTSEYRTPIELRGDGNHRVECAVRDIAGNAGTRTLDLRLDSTPAVCAIDGLDVSKLHAAPLDVKLVARDNTSGVGRVMYSLNGGDLRSYDAPIRLAEAGIHDIVCRVDDVAGNERSQPLDLVRVEGEGREVHAAPVPVTPDATVRTAQPIPGAGLGAILLAALVVATARRR